MSYRSTTAWPTWPGEAVGGGAVVSVVSFFLAWPGGVVGGDVVVSFFLAWPGGVVGGGAVVSVVSFFLAWPGGVVGGDVVVSFFLAWPGGVVGGGAVVSVVSFFLAWPGGVVGGDVVVSFFLAWPGGIAVPTSLSTLWLWPCGVGGCEVILSAAGAGVASGRKTSGSGGGLAPDDAVARGWCHPTALRGLLGDGRARCTRAGLLAVSVPRYVPTLHPRRHRRRGRGRQSWAVAGRRRRCRCRRWRHRACSSAAHDDGERSSCHLGRHWRGDLGAKGRKPCGRRSGRRRPRRLVQCVRAAPRQPAGGNRIRR